MPTCNRFWWVRCFQIVSYLWGEIGSTWLSSNVLLLCAPNNPSLHLCPVLNRLCKNHILLRHSETSWTLKISKCIRCVNVWLSRSKTLFSCIMVHIHTNTVQLLHLKRCAESCECKWATKEETNLNWWQRINACRQNDPTAQCWVVRASDRLSHYDRQYKY